MLTLWKALKAQQIERSWINTLDEVLSAGELSIGVKMGMFSIPLIGFRSWKWLKKIFSYH